MNEIAIELYNKLIDAIPDDSAVLLDCGHFDSVDGVDDFSINTTKIAVDMFNLSEKKRRKGVKFLFPILIDDVGMQCSEDAMMCLPKSVMAIPQRVKVPSEIEAIIEKTIGFRNDRLKLFSEKTARNRGIQYFRKSLTDTVQKKSFYIKQQDKDSVSKLFCVLPNGTSVLMADMTTKSTWSGHCPLLMGMHYRDITMWALKRFPHAKAVSIIDFSLYADRGKVNAGAAVAFGAADDLLQLQTITNICFADEDTDVYSLDTHERAVT